MWQLIDQWKPRMTLRYYGLFLHMLYNCTSLASFLNVRKGQDVFHARCHSRCFPSWEADVKTCNGTDPSFFFNNTSSSCNHRMNPWSVSLLSSLKIYLTFVIEIIHILIICISLWSVSFFSSPSLMVVVDTLKELNLGFNRLTSLHQDIGLYLKLTTLDLRWVWLIFFRPFGWSFISACMLPWA